MPKAYAKSPPQLSLQWAYRADCLVIGVAHEMSPRTTVVEFLQMPCIIRRLLHNSMKCIARMLLYCFRSHQLSPHECFPSKTLTCTEYVKMPSRDKKIAQDCVTCRVLTQQLCYILQRPFLLILAQGHRFNMKKGIHYRRRRLCVEYEGPLQKAPHSKRMKRVI